MLPNILLYVGTLLIAFELIGDLSHLFALPLHFIGQLAKFLVPQKEDKSSKTRNACLNSLITTPMQTTFVLLLILVVALCAVLLVIWAIGTLLLYINGILNIAYARALDPRKTNYIRFTRSFVALAGKDDPNKSDLDIWEGIKKRGFRFVGLIGIIILSVGFTLQLLGL
ncbi:MAG: hypothetical protein NT134_03910 [Chloroflexi bacterium]|nr:hypothetical protein [Chloroflexota bacterium]